MSHHTKEQVDAAFAKAPGILRQLQEAGVESPRFELFSDASGTLVLGTDVTDIQYELATKLVKSMRPSFGHEGEVAITFCCGLAHEDPV